MFSIFPSNNRHFYVQRHIFLIFSSSMNNGYFIRACFVNTSNYLYYKVFFMSYLDVLETLAEIIMQLNISLFKS